MGLVSPANQTVGFVTICTQNAVDAVVHDVAPLTSNPHSPTATGHEESQQQQYGHRRTQLLPCRLMLEVRRPSQGWVDTYFANAVDRTYRFHSGLDGDIVVHETMLECRLNTGVPSQLLRLWIDEEKDLVRELVALGDYTQAQKSVDAAPQLYRPSRDKGTSTLQYCPVNLHLQRLWVQNESLPRSI